MKHGWILGLAVCLASSAAFGQAAATAPDATPAATAASGPGDIDLASRYFDLKGGFSIRPPAGTTRQKQASGSQQVSWTSRDAKTGAIEFTLTVQHAVESEKVDDLKKYSGKILERLKGEGFEHQSTSVGAIDAHDCFELRGLTGGGKFYQRQVWVQSAPTQFVIVLVSGPRDGQKRYDAIMDGVLKTVRIVDAQKLKAQRDENLARGKALLAKIDNDALKAIAADEPSCLLIRQKGKDVGFLVIRTTADSPDKLAGFAVRTLMHLDANKSVISQQFFTTADRKEETWAEKCTMQEGAKSFELLDEGARHGEQISTKVTADGAATPQVAKAPLEHYLPRAMGAILYRLVNLQAGSEVAFLTYDSHRKALATRTIRVEGTEAVEVGGKKVECFRLSDQAATDGEPVSVLVDSKGRVVRMLCGDTAEALTMEAVSPADLVKLYKQAQEILK